MKNIVLTIFGVMALGLVTISPVWSEISVVTSTPDLAALAREAGGNKVSVYSIAKPDTDYHKLEPRPSDVSKLAHAQVFVRLGMDLDVWADALMNAAGNEQVSKGGGGYVDASLGFTKLEVPNSQITGESGDIHAFGNPHYWYDPLVAKVIVKHIARTMSKVSPNDADYFAERAKAFTNEIDTVMKRWKRELSPYRGKKVVTYHDNFPYFMKRFGLVQLDTLEPKPGIPPSASHISQLIQKMKSEGVKAIVNESVYSRRWAELVAGQTGAKVELGPYSVGSLGTFSYVSTLDKLVQAFRKAMEQD